ncbi:MAG: hypothetical protein ABEJ61_02425 [Haloferacaceae archaeon]
MDREDLADHLAAVERRLTDGETDPQPLADDAALVARLDDLEDHAADLEDRLAEVESAVQALRGYVGGVESVNEDVERRANAAVARVDRLEERLDRRAESAPGSTSAPGVDETPDQGRDDAERVAMAARDAGNDGEVTVDPDAPTGDADRSLAGRLRDALS